MKYRVSSAFDREDTLLGVITVENDKITDFKPEGKTDKNLFNTPILTHMDIKVVMASYSYFYFVPEGADDGNGQ